MSKYTDGLIFLLLHIVNLKYQNLKCFVKSYKYFSEKYFFYFLVRCDRKSSSNFLTRSPKKY